ncbi:P-loop containing nucleoside triphosphate hydrolase [Glarea lozoyensis ATCC 20868]|uniref:GPN-loop GTPase 2 n=1 Tax=Glarea lozoyensis (strain ATCC 20868 / MF5171) TaxID=1116229 RepID=S3CPI9_GLAL2|nr:P-loop containing nucleoside triphosphate hydrolase [Glarea lozoyensis ATCC 20868]EPE28382.1 P-loop containing nucleoside triphosphate hydrolase [Glarea lozoyensis ATCC 20868]
MPFAQLVLGSPGAGKSTFCNGMQQFMSAIGRKCSVVNLDPANDHTGYPCAIDVRDLIKLEDIMEEDELGPNGGVLYALEELENNVEWLEKGLSELGEDYVLFDCPGQVELYTHHSSLRNIFFKLQKLGYRMVVLHLSDSYCLTLPSLFISNLILSLRAMLQMELPHLNVLTKIDKISSYSPLPFNLDYYTEVQDLSYLLPHLEAESSVGDKFKGLNEAIVQLVEDFGLVSFETLAVEDKRSMMSLLQVIDRAGGYAFGGAEGANDTVWQVAMREGVTAMDVKDVQERWIDAKDEYDEKERREWEEQAKARDEAERVKRAEQEDDEMDGMSMPRGDSGIKVVRKPQ